MSDSMPLYSGIFPKSLHEFKKRLSNNMVAVFCLDCYERWIVHVMFSAGWFYYLELFCVVVGKADELWIVNHFDEVY
jgi:hypothetical protein